MTLPVHRRAHVHGHLPFAILPPPPEVFHCRQRCDQYLPDQQRPAVVDEDANPQACEAGCCVESSAERQEGTLNGRAVGARRLHRRYRHRSWTPWGRSLLEELCRFWLGLGLAAPSVVGSVQKDLSRGMERSPSSLFLRYFPRFPRIQAVRCTRAFSAAPDAIGRPDHDANYIPAGLRKGGNGGGDDDPEPPPALAIFSIYLGLGTLLSFGFGRDLATLPPADEWAREVSPTIIIICLFLTSYSLFDVMAVGVAKQKYGLSTKQFGPWIHNPQPSRRGLFGTPRPDKSSRTASRISRGGTFLLDSGQRHCGGSVIANMGRPAPNICESISFSNGADHQGEQNREHYDSSILCFECNVNGDGCSLCETHS